MLGLIVNLIEHVATCICAKPLQTTGRTALFFAAENGHDAAVSILLAYGADPNQKDVVNFITLNWYKIEPEEKMVTPIVL